MALTVDGCCADFGEPTYARIHTSILHMYEFQNRPTAGSSDCLGCALRPPGRDGPVRVGAGLPFSRDRFPGAVDAIISHRGGVMPATVTDRHRWVVDGLLRLGSADIWPFACVAIRSHCAAPAAAETVTRLALPARPEGDRQ
jgi:hypothetical protein